MPRTPAPIADLNVSENEGRGALRRWATLSQRVESDQSTCDELVLRANLSGMTYDEIAETIGLARATVAKAITRARARLSSDAQSV